MIDSADENQKDDNWKANILHRLWRVEVLFVVAMLTAFLSPILWNKSGIINCNVQASNPSLYDGIVAKMRDDMLNQMRMEIEDYCTTHQITPELEQMVSNIFLKEFKTTMHRADQTIKNSKTSDLQRASNIEPIKNISSKSNHQKERLKVSETSNNFDGKQTHFHSTMSRSLQFVEFSEECNGTLFELELKLDLLPFLTSWELINDETSLIVANQSYVNPIERSKENFEQCVERGSYTFILWAFGDGISCNERQACYNIFLNDKLAIEGNSFGRKIIHHFDTSSTSLCVVGSAFVLQVQSELDDSHINWKLEEKTSNKEYHLEPTEDKSGNFSKSFFTCLSHGIYVFGTFFTNLNGTPCSDCYQVLIKNELFIQGNTFSRISTFSFSISADETVNERRCHKSPPLSPVNEFNNFTYNDEESKTINILNTISPVESRSNNDSPQYQAACWLFFDEKVEFERSNQTAIERYVVSVFLYSTNQNAEIWLPDNSCNFYGITCNKEGLITGIRWNNRGLAGSIPSELSFLNSLESLELVGNSLKGSIPPDLGRLSNLKKLDISHNQLTGTVPTMIGELLNLEVLRLNSNQLDGNVPSEIGLCANLQEFLLGSNKFEGLIPAELFDCTFLKLLSLEVNHLSGTIPTNMDKLENMKRVILFNNELTGQIPTQIGKLSSLEWLILDFNKLTGPLPTEIGELDKLGALFVRFNNLSGTLPAIFENLSQLRAFFLSTNQFHGEIPSSLWDLPRLEQLDMQNNKLQGTVPDSFCSKMDLFYTDESTWFIDDPKVDCPCCNNAKCHLWESDGVFKGPTSVSCPNSNIGKITYFNFFDVIDLATNAKFLTRTFVAASFDSSMCLSPTGCYEFKKGIGTNTSGAIIQDSYTLGYSSSSMSLVENNQCEAVQLCGKLYDLSHPKRKGLNHITQRAINDMNTLNDPTSLEYKALCWLLEEDTLFHTFEVCDGTLLQRYVLLLFYLSVGMDTPDNSKHTCEWTGITCDSAHKFVEDINLSNEILTGNLTLTGTLVAEIGLLPRLKTFNLNDNQLQGTIDPSIFLNLPNLRTFDVGNNRFRGEIPQDLFLLPLLRRVDFSTNLFTGTLPNKRIHSKDFEYLDISENLLRGSLPEAFFTSNSMKHINTSQNGFHGFIPHNLGDIQPLETLILDQNRISGSIPIRLFDSSNIKVLMLQSNDLTGTIPTQIKNLVNATQIILNHNLLRGTIPNELSQFEKLEFLHLHENSLTGTAPNLSIKTFIADCGSPSFLLDSQLECKTCTMCCNSDTVCQLNKGWNVSLPVSSVVVVVCIPIGLALCICLMLNVFKDSRLWKWLKDLDPKTAFFTDSVYCFALSRNIAARIFYYLTAGMQIWILSTYLDATSTRPERFFSRDAYPYICPSNSIDCDQINSNKVDNVGWLLFFLITVVFLGKDLGKSLLRIARATVLSDFELGWSGLSLFGLTVLTAYTSYVYNLATVEKNADLITNAVILFFVNDLDEKVMDILLTFAPDWTDARIDELKRIMLEKCGTFERHKSNIEVESDMLSENDIREYSEKSSSSGDRINMDSTERPTLQHSGGLRFSRT